MRKADVGIELDLVLLHEAADARDLRDAGNGFERVAELPVLQAAQVGQAQAMAAVDQHVLVHPSGAGRVGPDARDAHPAGSRPPICCRYSKTRERAQ